MNQRRRPAALALLASVFWAPTLVALYAFPDLAEVPLARLIANAEARIQTAPEGTFALHTLARIHAMAYAWKLGDDDTVEASSGNAELLIPSFGIEPPFVPWTRPRRLPGGSENGAAIATAGEAGAHLEAAIRHYRRTLELDSENVLARLGLAWTLIERGEAAEARTLLRAVVEVAAPRELERQGRRGPLLAVEAIDYLLPLLDSSSDRAEVAALRDQRGRLEALPRSVTPIAVALEPGLSAAELIDAAHPVRFDLDGSGRDLPWSWLHPDAAWLVYDRHDNGEIRSALQLFGSRSFGLFFEHGYQALELLDDDRDGELRGPELEGIALWRDTNRDGISDRHEVVPVLEAGIVAIGCRSTGYDGEMLAASGSVELASGRLLDSWDLVLEDLTVTAPAPESGSRRGPDRTTTPD